MNDMILSAEKLLELNRMALRAETEFEKAAVYGAVKGLYAQFEEAYNNQRLSGYLWGKAASSCEWTAAVVGYDVTNSHPLETVAQLAYNDAHVLVSELKHNERDIELA